MKLTEKTKRLIVMGIAMVMVIFGLLGAVFKIKIDLRLINQISTILLVIAAMLLFSGRKQRGDTAQQSAGEEKPGDSTAADETDPKEVERQEGERQEGERQAGERPSESPREP